MNHRFTRLPATGFAHDWMQKIRTDEAIRELKTEW